MERNTPDGTGPMHVPFGHIVANEKWRGSQLAQGMQGKIKLVFEDGLTPVDFYLSSRSCILYITEADLVAGNGYRKRLVRVRNSSKLQGIVVVEKTHMSEQYFPAVQKFTVLDLGMVLLPVASQTEASCLIIQLGSNLHPLHWKGRVLTTGLPGKSRHVSFVCTSVCKFMCWFFLT
ncbi:Fanconi anemia core complex-associated protein 24 isoform X2 [Delphinapterus leucas]|uniref:Fanconi anemia core complex-associated protein 24 isoform X2 n=1 Tax=Delphinapterus leucas TaxID=9749 RepID=A0A7F8K3F8_DELLE|nr:Fanconi anemia core complex-associated protein 24 isoform X2 [Delphinapterus leucas]